MRIDIVTIFPGMFPGPLGESVVGRALERRLVEVVVHDLRDWATPPHRQVDDEPYGGGGGMVLKPEPLFAAIEAVLAEVRAAGVEPGPVALLTPQGERLEQRRVETLAGLEQLTLICGRYEGVDERIREQIVDFELSIGDYVVSGGELPAMLLIDAIARLQPGALGDAEATRRDSFSDALLDYPQYTRPAQFRGSTVPDVLRSGDHAAIARWRRQQALLVTARKRPDLLARRRMSAEERHLLEEAGATEDLAAPQLDEDEGRAAARREDDVSGSENDDGPERVGLATGAQRQE